jgi:hypothetical protein
MVEETQPIIVENEEPFGEEEELINPDGAIQPDEEELPLVLDRDPYTEEGLELTSSLAAAAQITASFEDPNTLEDFNTKTEDAKLAIVNGQEEQLRQSIAEKEAMDEFELTRDLLLDEAQKTEANLDKIRGLTASINAIGERAKDRDLLEKAALDRITEFAVAHPEQGDMLELMMQDYERGGSFAGTLRDQLERTVILRREADKAAKELSNQFIGSDVIDFLARMIPFNKLTSVDNLVESSMFNLSGTKIFLAQQNLLNIPRSQFDTVLPQIIEKIKGESAWIGENRSLILENIIQLRSLTLAQKTAENWWDFIDFATIAPSLRVVPTLTKSVIAKLAHNRELAKTIVVNTVEKETVTLDVKGVSEFVNINVIDELMTTSQRSTHDLVGGGVNTSGAVNTALEANQAGIRAVRDALENSPRLTPDEADNAFAAAKANAIEQHGEAAVVDFDVIKTVTDSGVELKQASMILGRKDGNGFSKEIDALDAAKRKGILDPKVLKADDGMWFINVTTDVHEAMYVLALKQEELSSSYLMNTFVRSPTSFLPDILQGRAATAVFTKGRIQRILKPLQNNLKGLSRTNRTEVAAVFAKGNISQKWYSLNEFKKHFADLHENRLPTEGQVLAYYTLKDINDFEHLMRNHSVYAPLASDGWVTGAVSAPNGVSVGARNMKQIDNVDDVGKSLILDVSNDVIVEGRKVGVDVIKDRIVKEGLTLLRLGRPVMHKGKPVNHILAKKGDLAMKELEYNQLNYSAGGHRFYKGKVLAQQTVQGVTESGAKYVMNPRTHVIGNTTGTVGEWVDRMNRAREAWLSVKAIPKNAHKAARQTTELEADGIIRNSGIEGGFDEWEALVKDGRIEADSPFQVVFDGEAPLGFKESLSKEGVYDLTFKQSSQESFLEQRGSMYYSKKGAILKSPQDETAEIIEPFSAANRAVENAANLSSFTNYRINAVDRWLKTFDSLLPVQEGITPTQRFFSTESLTGAPQNTLNKAESLRKAIQRQLRGETQLGKSYRIGLRNLADWVEGSAVGGTRPLLAAKVLNLMDKDPVSAIKGFAFDLKLGLFDPSQLIIQTQTIFALASLNPTKFHKFLADGALMRFAAVNQSDEMLSWAAKRSGMDANEFKSMMKTMRKSGITEINGEMVLFDHNATSQVGTLASAAETFRNMGRIPFFEAERWNRIYAWRKSWDDLRSGRKLDNGEKVPPMSVKDLESLEGRAELARLTDKFTMNMTSASAAFWQRGILSIPTQFLSYQARLLENVLPIIGNKQWTKSEKARLLMGQVLLYGAVGIPGGRYMMENIFEATGVEFDPDSPADQIAYRAIVGGFWDSMLYAVTNGELDVAFSQRAAVGQAVEDFYLNLSGGNPHANSFLEVIAGAPGSVIGDVSSDTWDTIKAIGVAASSSNVAVTDLVPSLLTNMALNASTLSRMHRAYYVLKYNEWRSQETGKVMTKATTTESIAAMLGFNLRELADGKFTQSLIRKRKDIIKDSAKLIGRLQVEASDHWRNGDKEAWRSSMDQITAWTQIYDPPMRAAISKRVIETVQAKTAAQNYRERAERDLAPISQPVENFAAKEQAERKRLRGQ